MFKITCSVRTLVEFVYLCGDLVRPFHDVQRAQEGAKIHRLLQRSSKDHYEAEVAFRHTTILDDICFEVEGRADGVIHRNDEIIIDEIKTTDVPYDEIMEDGMPVHWAQAKCYAYFYCVKHPRDTILISLTYYQMAEARTKIFEKAFTFAQLETFYFDLLKQYQKWALFAKQHKQARQISIKTLTFPFAQYRSGQRDLAVATYKTILDQKVLFAQAPTGIGKTISTLFPAVKALGEDKADRIFYVSAKTLTQKVAVDALDKMRTQGLQIKSVVIAAKDKCCLMEEKNCDPEICPYAKGYYDRLHEAMYALLTQSDHYELEGLRAFGKAWQLCPFELSLDLSLYCDVIIGDYNYVFDPQVYLKRFFQEQKERIVLLVDEAHNLVDRARMMFTKRLSKKMIQSAYASVPKAKRKLRKALALCKEEMEQLEQEREGRFHSEWEIRESLQASYEAVIEPGEHYLKETPLSNDDAFTTLYFELLAFKRIQELADDHFIYLSEKEDDDFIYEIFCLDPSSLLKKRMDEVCATILFSATLTPVSYFEQLLVGHNENRKLMLRSPFPSEHLHIAIQDRISTRYKDRLHTSAAIAELIFSAISMKTGNYMVFFPSYQYLQILYDLFRELYPQIPLLKQESGMTETEKTAFLARFMENREKTLLGFCVLGGMYGEGIDLQSDALIGCIIVGVGLPQVNERQELLKEYFDDTMEMGFAYAYICPGMSKVLQACGRVIRSEQDQGLLLLIDDRYRLPQWNALLPAHYRHYQVVHSPIALMKQLKRFWADPLLPAHKLGTEKERGNGD